MTIDFLYHFPKDDDFNWEVSPPGTLSVERFINDQAACWQQEKGMPTRQKKILVLSDFASGLYQHHERDQYLQGLQELLDQGFTIWAWQNGNDLVLLNKSNLHTKFVDNFYPADPTILLQSMAERNIPADHVAILDYPACRKLFFHETRPLIESHVVAGVLEDFLISQLAKCSLNELTTRNTEYGYNNKVFAKLLQTFSHLSQAPEELKLLHFDRHFTSKEFFQRRTKDELQAVTKVTVECDPTFTADTLAKLETYTPHIKSLTICDYEFFEDTIDDIDLHHLEHLTVNRCIITTAVVGKLLVAAPNLQSIDIKDCTTVKGSLDEACAQKLRLYALKELTLTDLPFLSSHLLSQILLQAPHLSELKVSNLHIVEETFDVAHYEKITLKNLEKLEFYNCNIPLQLFLIPLTYAPNIKNIQCYYTNFSGSMQSNYLKELKLHSLETLYFVYSNATTALIEAILFGAPNLHVIGFRGCEELTDDFDFKKFREKGDLSKLKTLQVSQSSISSRLLLALLQKTKKLQYLCADSCIYLGSSFDIDGFRTSLSHLRSLSFGHPQLDITAIPLLQLLVYQAPNIESLEISSSGDLIINAFLNDHLTFSQLTSLTCSDMSLCPSSFLTFLARCPKLTTLHIYTCKILSNPYHDAANFQLPNLNQLTASFTQSSSTLLVKLLQSAPNLVDLNIGKCPSLFSEQVEQIYLPHLQRITGDNIPEDLKNKVKEAFPNVEIKDRGSTSRPPRFNQKAASKTHQLDTSPSSKTIHFTRIFEAKDGDHPPLSDYRLEVFDSLRLGKNPPLLWYNADETTLTPCKAPPTFVKSKEELDKSWDRARAPGHKFYLATYNIPSTHSWLPLPSYYPDETITHIFADGQILYSESKNLYYFNLHGENAKGSGNVVYYIIKVPTPLAIRVLDSGVQALVKKYNNFNHDDPKITNPDITGEAFIAAIKEQHTGVCEHRAAACYHELKQDFPHVRVRGEMNSGHIFLFIKHQDRWVRCDLGGAPANVVIDEKNHPDLFHNKIQISENSRTDKSIEKYLHTHIIRDGKKSLIKVHSEEECKNSRSYIGSHHFANTLEQLEDLRLTKKAIIVVNLSTFSEDEMAKFIKMQFGASICLIGLYIIKGSFVEETEKFLDFFDTKLELLPFKPAPFKTTTLEQPQQKESPKPLLPTPITRPSMYPLLERKILETLWNISSDYVKPFSFTFDGSGMPTNMVQFLNEVLQSGKNVHIGFSSQDELDLCSYWIQQQINNSYYIDRPSDIRCASRWIDDNGIPQTVPGGPLHRYLTSSPNPLLIINFNSFEVEDLVGCNSIIDTQYREADGQRLSDNAIVLGLSVTGPESYDESDFTGRFYSRLRVTPFYSPYPIEFQESGDTTVDLFGVEDWKEQLSGKWIIKKDRLKRKKGLLEKGHTNLEIQNGQWENRDFRHFWLQQSLTKDIALSKTTNTGREQFQNQIAWVDSFPEGICPRILNPSLLGRMMTTYQIEDTALDTLPGIIKQNKGNNLYAYLTSQLRDGQWYRLLSLCKKENVRLHILAADGIKPVTCAPQASIIITASIDKTAQEMPGATVIDVTDLDARALFGINAHIIDARFQFSHSYGAIWKLLLAGEHVLLKGKFNNKLLDVLMPLLLYGTLTNGQESIQHKGKLTLVTDSTAGLELFHVTKKADVQKGAAYTIPQIKVEFNPTLHPVDQERLQMVIDGLNREYHVCIEGETGVGKTTFIKEVLAKQPFCTVFYGIKNLAACATCDNGTTPILFLDEINAQNRQFNCLEGLYSDGIVDDEGTYHRKNPLMRVVSCQNQQEYGAERKEVEFLKRHPNTITFTALPTEFLKERYNLDNLLVEVFKKVPELTPRELEMIRLMPNPHLAAYRIARCSLPLSKQNEFTDWFKGNFRLNEPKVNIDLGNFELTESRKEIASLMSDLLAIRKQRVQGGLGGIVLEGKPGDGKSHFAEAILRFHGIIKVEPHEIGDVGFDAYCKIPAKMDAADKARIRLMAFHAGQVVVEEEANVSKAQEAEKNALLMGFDENLTAAKKPGFFTIRTQNPITMKNRRATSKADKRRTITYAFAPYPQKEIYQILLKRYPGLSSEVVRYITQKKLSFRELLHIIERGLAAPKNILKHLPDMPEQQGQTCKLYALGAVMNWLYSKHAVPPARKSDRQGAQDSLRALAKREGYTQVGEIYSPEHLVAIAKRHGFASTKVVESTQDSYIETLKQQIDKKRAPIVFFDVDPETAKPILAESKQEHAAVCVGYFFSLQNELFFTLLHWAKPWVVSAKELAASANNLSQNREPETFYKVDGFWRAFNDRNDSQRGDLKRIVESKSYEKAVSGKKSADTFRNKLIVIRESKRDLISNYPTP